MPWEAHRGGVSLRVTAPGEGQGMSLSWLLHPHGWVHPQHLRGSGGGESRRIPQGSEPCWGGLLTTVGSQQHSHRGQEGFLQVTADPTSGSLCVPHGPQRPRAPLPAGVPHLLCATSASRSSLSSPRCRSAASAAMAAAMAPPPHHRPRLPATTDPRPPTGPAPAVPRPARGHRHGGGASAARGR